MTSPYTSQKHSSYAQEPYLLPTPKPPKPPIHNPYDKFTQPEFESWIGGITDALKRALGQETEIEEESKAHESDFSPVPGGIDAELPDDSESQDEVVDDSFAEIKARRALGKGKARDPREGPGFGAGDIHHPIEIDLNSDSEGEQEQEGEGSEEEEEDWDEQEKNSEEEEQVWAKGESSAQAQIRRSRRDVDSADEDEVQSEQGYSDEEEPEVEQGVEEEEILLSSSEDERDGVVGDDEDELERDESPAGTHGVRPIHDEVVNDEDVSETDPEIQEAEYISDTDDVDDAEQDDNAEDENAQILEYRDDKDLPPLSPRAPRVVPPFFETLEDEDFFIEIPHHKIDGSNVQGTRECVNISADFDDGLVEASISSPKARTTLLNPDKALHELREASATKPKATPPATAQLEVCEPDEGEDKVTFSPVPFFSSTEPHHHAVANEQPMVYDVDMDKETVELEETVIQPIAEDTSFPLHEASPVSIKFEAPVEIPDVWDGPKTYAEDYYSGGDVRPEAAVEIGAHHLGDQEVIISTPKPPAIAETVPNDVIVVDSPKQSPCVRSNQPPESLEEIVQPTEEEEVVEQSEQISSSPLRPPTQEIPGSQEGQFTQGLSYDDLYDIDMASFDTSTFNMEQTVGSWDLSDIPSSDRLPSFQESKTPTIVDADAKPIELIEDSHIHDSHTPPEEIELCQPVEGEKPEVQGLPAMDELVEVAGLVNTREPIEVRESVQELAAELDQDDGSVVASQTVDLQVPDEVVEPAEMQDVVETHTQDDGFEDIQEHLQPQDIEANVGIVIISDSGQEVFEHAQDTFLTVWDEPPSIHIEPPSPIPPTTPTTEQQQSFESQAEDFSMQPEPLQPMNDHHDSENTFVPTAHTKYETTTANHPDMDDGLPTPPSEPFFEANDVDAFPENVEQLPLSTSDSTPGYEIIINEDDNGEADLTVQITDLCEESHEATTIDDGALGAPENLHTATIKSDVTNNLVDCHAGTVPPLPDICPDTPSPQGFPLPPLHFPISSESPRHDPDLTEIGDPTQHEEQIAQQDSRLSRIASTSPPTLESTFMPVGTDSPIPDPTIRSRAPMMELPPINDSPNALNTILSPSGSSIPPTSPPVLHSMQVAMRESTHPVLLSDPYPYSLSTPGYDSNNTTYEPSEEETTEQENSLSSSSTFDKDVDREKELNGDDTGNGTEPDFFEMDLRYPSDSDHSPIIPTSPPLTKASETLESYHNDTDADGDIDPDFGGTHDTAYMSPPQPPVTPIHPKDDPFIATSPNFPDVRENGEKHTANQRKSSSSSLTKSLASPSTNGSGSNTFGMSIDGLPSILIVKPKPPPRMQIPHEEDLEELTELEDSPPRAPKPPRPPKRKLSASFLQGFSPITRSMATKTPELSGSSLVKSAMKRISSKSSISASSLAKGKRKERSDRQVSEQPSESGKSSGSASKIPRRDTNASRESSIASSAPSDKSFVINQPSPTVNKPINSRPPAPPPPPPPPPPLMHTHSHAFRHVHHPPSAPQPPRVQTQVRKASSLGSPAGESSKPAPPPQQPARGAGSFTSSPVTRSNCRYHKISIPKEEDDPDGPRVYFIIPGCSLGDKKLINEEYILDHGDATHEDSLRMVQDMEGWGVHPYIIGVLRVMAGVDTTREQDFYYLPEPGEVPPEPKPSPEKLTSAKHPSRSHYENGATHGSPRTPVVSHPSPTSSKAPISTASSSTASTKESLGGTKRGLKRSRTSDVYGGEEALDRGQKKLKARQAEWWRDD